MSDIFTPRIGHRRRMGARANIHQGGDPTLIDRVRKAREHLAAAGTPIGEAKVTLPMEAHHG